MNITYQNETAIKICQGVINKLKYKRFNVKFLTGAKMSNVSLNKDLEPKIIYFMTIMFIILWN